MSVLCLNISYFAWTGPFFWICHKPKVIEGLLASTQDYALFFLQTKHPREHLDSPICLFQGLTFLISVCHIVTSSTCNALNQRIFFAGLKSCRPQLIVYRRRADAVRQQTHTRHTVRPATSTVVLLLSFYFVYPASLGCAAFFLTNSFNLELSYFTALVNRWDNENVCIFSPLNFGYRNVHTARACVRSRRETER